MLVSRDAGCDSAEPGLADEDCRSMNVNVKMSSSSFTSLRRKLGAPFGLLNSGSWLQGQCRSNEGRGKTLVVADLDVFYVGRLAHWPRRR